MRVLITRPRDDAGRLAEALRPMGIEPLLEPLFRIDHPGGPKLDLDGVQALLVTSANGVRAFAARDDRRDLTVYAVGDASARAAAEVGFADVESASGDVEDLARLVRRRLDPAQGAVFHAAGTRVAGDLAGMVEEAGFTYRRAVLYEARAADGFSAATVQALKAGTVDGALFFSPRTATCFVDLVRKSGLAGACERIIAFCLSPAVAGKANALTWREICVAAQPDQAALLAAVFSRRGGARGSSR